MTMGYCSINRQDNKILSQLQKDIIKALQEQLLYMILLTLNRFKM